MDFKNFLKKQVQNCYKLLTFQNTGQSCILGNSKVQHSQIKKKKKKLFKLSFYLTVPCFYILEFIDVAGLFWLGGGRRTPRWLELTSS